LPIHELNANEFQRGLARNCRTHTIFTPRKISTFDDGSASAQNLKKNRDWLPPFFQGIASFIVYPDGNQKARKKQPMLVLFRLSKV
jgi:hypothetical protein